jgi:hypothetical protein
VLGGEYNNTGQNSDLDEQSILPEAAVGKSGRQAGKEMHLRIAELGALVAVGFAGQLLKIQEGRWQTQDVQDVVAQAR